MMNFRTADNVHLILLDRADLDRLRNGKKYLTLDGQIGIVYVHDYSFVHGKLMEHIASAKAIDNKALDELLEVDRKRAEAKRTTPFDVENLKKLKASATRPAAKAAKAKKP